MKLVVEQLVAIQAKKREELLGSRHIDRTLGRKIAWTLRGRARTLAVMADEKRAQVLEAIRRALAPVSEVRAAILFGSHATGCARQDSDIDVAVLLAPGVIQRDKQDDCLRRLIAALSRELAADRLDVVILNTAPHALAFQTLKHGRVAFERDPRDLHRFRVRTYSAHADYAHVERLFRAATKQRALAGLDRG